MGAVGGLTVLSAYYIRRRRHLKKRDGKYTTNNEIFFSLYKELFTYSIPFVVVGLAIPLYQTIDTFTINKLLIQIGYMQGEAEKLMR